MCVCVWGGGRTAAVAGVVALQRQRLAGTTVTPPPTAITEATLVVTHQLLNNPLLPHASPSAVEQWCHDVDQLIIAAINTPLHGGR
jgi:hypothetical protein